MSERLDRAREEMKREYLRADDEAKRRFYLAWTGGWHLVILTGIIALGIIFVAASYWLKHVNTTWPLFIVVGFIGIFGLLYDVHRDMREFAKFLRENLPK